MSFLTPSGIQDPEDASLSDRLALWMIEQQQLHTSAAHTRPRIGMLAPMGYARDGGWPVYAGDAPTAYAILEAGGFPMLIPTLPLIEGFDPFHLLSDERAFTLLFGLIWPVMRELDGLILTGGGDLYSCLYGQTPHPQTETPDMWRDVWERYIALLAWLLCIPTLGICRGMQLMNVVLGGTLYQDLQAQWPKERPALLRHHARGRVSSSTWSMHPVQVPCPESRLALAVRGSGELDRHTIDPVLSMHHQAIQTLAPDLVVVCLFARWRDRGFRGDGFRTLVGRGAVPSRVDDASHLVARSLHRSGGGQSFLLDHATRRARTLPWTRSRAGCASRTACCSTSLHHRPCCPESIMAGRRRRCLSPSRGTDESRAAWSHEQI